MKIQTSFAAGAAFLLISAYCISAQIIIPRTDLKADMEDNVIIARLADGDSVIAKIEQMAEQFNVKQGMVLFGIGQLRDFTLGQYNPVSKRYVSKTFSTPWELVSLQGTIARENTFGGWQFNFSATLSDSSGNTLSGHLSQGIVSIINEIVVLKLSDISITRIYNVENGLWEMNIYPR